MYNPTLSLKFGCYIKAQCSSKVCRSELEMEMWDNKKSVKVNRVKVDKSESLCEKLRRTTQAPLTTHTHTHSKED